MLNNLASVDELINAVQSDETVSGLTHNFYRYPARFSPNFARTVIKMFTKPGDLVVDPFMGGGTTLVEASAQGRLALGTDLSSLAAFVTEVKTTILSDTDISALKEWTKELPIFLNLHQPPNRHSFWIKAGYQKHLNSRKTWPIRKTIELILSKIENLSEVRQQKFFRCALLRTAQWALDNRKIIPSAENFRKKLFHFMNEMIESSKEYSTLVKSSFLSDGYKLPVAPHCVHNSAEGIENVLLLRKLPSPALILTSPPYPGVHILYHRWQVQGRKETPAPFWIANCIDGKGASHYTFGDRKTHHRGTYYDNLQRSFSSIVKVANENTIIVQLMGFSDPRTQLPTLLQTLNKVGLSEITNTQMSNSPDGRIWRKIPNRKWYVDNQWGKGSEMEVVLFHRITKAI